MSNAAMPDPSDIAFLVVRPLVWFAIPLSVATAASMFNSPGIRGIRNTAIATCYLILPVCVVLHGWSAVVGAWVLLALTAGFSYWGYEMISRVVAVPGERGRFPSPRTVLHGFVAWPIMLPEVIEYGLADLGIVPTGSRAND